ncbi:DUF2017 family protein [Microbacterium sp. GXF7504]
MSGPVIMDITRVEALHLRELVAQFVDLLSDPRSDDPAVARLTPSAYPDDPDAAREFRSVTERELLRRRTDDAGAVLADLAVAGDVSEIADLPMAEAVTELEVPLDAERAASWMRTLNAVRLVLAERLGIQTEDDVDATDPRFAVYEWLGYRLDTLVRALDDAPAG